MKLKLAFFCLIGFVPSIIFAQPGRKLVAEGNQLYQEKKYDEATLKYRDALVNNPDNPLIQFNIGDAEYKKNKFEEAIKNFESSLSIDDILTQSKTYYNLGNTLYKMGKLPESILAYTQALKLNPEDEDAKFNLEFVRAKLKEQAQKQPQQNQQQQNQQQQQDQQQQQQDEQEKQEQEQQEQKQQQQEQAEQEQQQNEQQQPEPQEMSKEEAERILEALNKDDKDLQQEKKTKRAGSVRVLKDW